MDLKLNNREIELLKIILDKIVVKSRTGELGIIHGADRFVSTNVPLKKGDIEDLEKLTNKIGLRGLNKFDK